MLNTGFSLQEDACEALVRPHAAAGRIAELDAALRAIRAQFAEEQAHGQAELERNLRAWTTLHTRGDLVDRCLALAARVRAGFSSYVHVGIGGSDLGARVCQEVLCHTLHNELPDEARGAPRIYFAGDTFDPRPLAQLLDTLAQRGELGRTCFNIVSKSGKTPETLCAMLTIRERLGANWARQMVLTTEENPAKSILFRLTEANEFIGVLPVPDGVGGRFSVPSPVGLLPLAVAAAGETPEARVQAALGGYAEGHERMLLPADDPANIAFRIARWLQEAEEAAGISSLVLYDYSNCRMLGDWLVQLYTESIQERTAGMNVIAARGPTSNHSLLNGVIRGPRDKVALFVRWADLGDELSVPEDDGIAGDLAVFMGKGMKTLQEASLQGTLADFRRNGVPALVLTVPRRDAYNLFLVMRVLMDMVAVKGRLQQLHIDADSRVSYPCELTYQQDGVEGYKRAMRDYLAR